MSSAGALKSFRREAKFLPKTWLKKQTKKETGTITEIENLIRRLFHFRLLVMRRL